MIFKMTRPPEKNSNVKNLIAVKKKFIQNQSRALRSSVHWSIPEVNENNWMDLINLY